MAEKNLPSIRLRLLRWYDKNKRDLPWRKTKDPYAIWVAETMLQQTQIKTVILYYDRFLKVFPTVRALARAPQQQVLRVWSGLGYYRRAENLKRAARQLMRRHEGRIPRLYDDLRSLPGIGNYTAGAVLSIAFQQRYPALDGNARRVLSRLFNLTDDKELHARAIQLISPSRPGDFNQSLMELGATLCTPRTPNCAACPVTLACAARPRMHLRARATKTGNGHEATGNSKILTRRQSVLRNVTWPLAIVRREGKILLRQRVATGLLAHLWELPGGEVAQRSRPEAALRRQLGDLSGDLSRPQRIGEFRHSITYRRIRAPIYLFDYCPAGKVHLPARRWRWTQRSELGNYPMSSMTRKALRLFDIHEKSFF
jgi:A/G-specific adenine glycosylase